MTKGHVLVAALDHEFQQLVFSDNHYVYSVDQNNSWPSLRGYSQPLLFT